MNVVTSASFCTNITEINTVESWGAACRTFQAKTPDTVSDNPGTAATVSLGLGSADLQVTGYIDSVSVDRRSGLTTVNGRDRLRRAVEYFLVPNEDGSGEYQTTGSDAGQEIANLLDISGVTIAPTNLGFTLMEGYDFSLMSVWDAVQEICNIGQWRVYVGSSGSAYLSDAQITTGSSSQTIVDKEAIVDMQYKVSSEETINRVVVTGPEVRAVATSGSSPISWTKTALIHRNWIDTEEKAQAIADLNLGFYEGLTETGYATLIGYPTIHVGDTITIDEQVAAPIGMDGDWLVFGVNRTANQRGVLSKLTLRR